MCSSCFYCSTLQKAKIRISLCFVHSHVHNKICRTDQLDTGLNQDYFHPSVIATLHLLIPYDTRMSSMSRSKSFCLSIRVSSPCIEITCLFSSYFKVTRLIFFRLNASLVNSSILLLDYSTLIS